MACQAPRPDVPNRTRLVVLIERGRGVFAVVAVAPTGPMPAQVGTLVGTVQTGRFPAPLLPETRRRRDD